jgi:hypothetical protein
MADMRDGTPVYANSHIGGLAEVMVTFEEWVVPVVTKASAADLGMVCSCVAVAGLGATTSQGTGILRPGSSVAVVGCGRSASARCRARASRARRDHRDRSDPRAPRSGAEGRRDAGSLDPNVEGRRLVAKVRELTKGPERSAVVGGRRRRAVCSAAPGPTSSSRRGRRPRCRRAPSAARPDRASCRLRQAYEMCAAGGDIVTTEPAARQHHLARP